MKLDVSLQLVLCSMVVLGSDMKQEVYLYLVLHNKAMLEWETNKPNHTTEEVPATYTSEVAKKGKSQYAVELADDTWEAFD